MCYKVCCHVHHCWEPGLPGGGGLRAVLDGGGWHLCPHGGALVPCEPWLKHETSDN